VNSLRKGIATHQETRDFTEIQRRSTVADDAGITSPLFRRFSLQLNNILLSVQQHVADRGALFYLEGPFNVAEFLQKDNRTLHDAEHTRNIRMA
jgi:hypothetical protein